MFILNFLIAHVCPIYVYVQGVKQSVCVHHAILGAMNVQLNWLSWASCTCSVKCFSVTAEY